MARQNVSTKESLIQQIQDFFGDTSRTPEETLCALEDIQSVIEDLIAALKEDMKGDEA